MNRLPLIPFLILLSVGAFSQVVSDSIHIDETALGLKFYFQNQVIKDNQVSSLLETNFELYDLFETGREARVFGTVFATIGTGLLAIPFVTTLLGEKTNWAYTLAGTGFIGISIPLFRSYHNKTQSAIDQYNTHLSSSPKRNETSGLSVGVNNTGIGLVWSF